MARQLAPTGHDASPHGGYRNPPDESLKDGGLILLLKVPARGLNVACRRGRGRRLLDGRQFNLSLLYGIVQGVQPLALFFLASLEPIQNRLAVFLRGVPICPDGVLRPVGDLLFERFKWPSGSPGK
jgi:hypothetical protein